MPLHSVRDLRIWILSQGFGWPGRRVAEEVGTSQPTVVRTLARLEDNPPSPEELQQLIIQGDVTPPAGLPVIKPRGARPEPRRAPPVVAFAFAFAIILVALGVVAVLCALTMAILRAPV